MEPSSRDLLTCFADSTSPSEQDPPPVPTRSADIPPELSLGLSLGGGSFGSSKTKLIRSSSISSFPWFGGSGEAKESSSVGPLARTWSLPVAGVEEDYRKRKELQSLKRMEAKRKRSEKRNYTAAATATAADAVGNLKTEESGGCPWPPGSRRASGSGSGSSGSGGDDAPSMQGFDISKHSSFPEAKSPPLPTDRPNQPVKKIEMRGSWTGEMERSMMEEMPCVSTRGDGPNGRRVEGFLYKYRKGEEVRIVCVCHGSFLTPAEFVRHAGGGNVDHPLRHIVVNPTPSALM
ncbi:ninja-family protein AFP3-like [Iris pallida]|uniref:Ninja-family protein n=1 Tax=Iris pallida TaxID=29817 RepID=A0AAX6G2A4_IRIPA|nr:ninja-family protein AFP3-like [Iris pallida]